MVVRETNAVEKSIANSVKNLGVRKKNTPASSTIGRAELRAKPDSMGASMHSKETNPVEISINNTTKNLGKCKKNDLASSTIGKVEFREEGVPGKTVWPASCSEGNEEEYRAVS